MSSSEFQIVIDESFSRSKPRMKTLLARLEKAGLSDVRSLESICVVTGRANPEKAAELANVPGVVAVENAGVAEVPEPVLRSPLRAEPIEGKPKAKPRKAARGEDR